MGKSSSLIKNSALYTINSIITKAVGFLMLPIYTRFLTPEDFGITNLVNSFTYICTYIVSLSLFSSAMRFYADYKTDPQKLKRFYSTIVIFVTASSIVFVTVGTLFQNYLIKLLFTGISFIPIVFTSLIIAAFLSLRTLHEKILQGMQNGKKLMMANLSAFALQTILTVIFIVFFKTGAFGVLLAWLLANVAYFIFMIIDLIHSKLICFCIDFAILKESLAYSIPLIPHHLSTQIATFTSRIFLNNSNSLATVGLYGVVMQFGLVIDLVQTAVYSAFSPWFFELMNDGIDVDKKKIIADVTQFLGIVYSLMYLVIGLFAQEALIIMTSKNYASAWFSLPILITGFSLKSIYYFYVNILLYHKEAANKIFISTLFGSLTNIVFAYIMVPIYSVYGAAFAFLLSKLIVNIIIIVMTTRYEKVGFNLFKMHKTIAFGIVFMLIGLYFSYTKYPTEFNIINFAYKIAILIVYIVFIILTNKKLLKAMLQSEGAQKFYRKVRRSK